MKKLKKMAIAISLVAIWALQSCDSRELEQLASTPESEQVSSSNSNYVSLEEAEMQLDEILDMLDTCRARAESKRVVSKRYTISLPTRQGSRSESTQSIHIFNFSDDRGYAIMSGDRRITSMLALVESGEFSLNSVMQNPNLMYFYERLTNYIDNKTSDSDSETESVKSRSYSISKPTVITQYSNLCPVKWGQEDPYNNYCPLSSSGTRTVTGCVPTAVAQFMACFKYPSSYSSYSFDWDEMVKSSPSDTATDQIAKLMYYLGLSANLNVSYGVESSASPKNIPKTLTNFGYSKGGSLVDYSAKSVASEIAANRPVLISGSSSSAGHQWLIHGMLEFKKQTDTYNDNGSISSSLIYYTYYFQCNWGWEGSDDGYYYSEVFSPAGGSTFDDDYSRADSYSKNLKIILGARK